MSERAVWEETWAPGDGVLHTEGARIAVFEPVARPHEPISDTQQARARLAAAAPDLARALLVVEQHGYNDTGKCPNCFLWEGDGHADCALDVALRKAGVR